MAKKKSLYATALSTSETPQTQAIPGREAEMTKNNAGGVSFKLDGWKHLERFLILGSESGSYYCSPQKLTAKNASNLINLIKADGRKVVHLAAKISLAGRAPKNDPALFALAAAASFGDQQVKAYALDHLKDVARIGTHLFHFADYVNSMRGWGRGLRRAIGDWYLSRKPESLAMQLLKYQSRDGWSHSDLLRLAHPKTSDPAVNAMFRYVRRGENSELLPKLFEGVRLVKEAKTGKDVAKLIRDYGLTREMLPTEHLNSIEVWEALLEKMPLTAMIRNLNKMTNIGLLKPLSSHTKMVVNAMANSDNLKKARIHPLNVLIAQKTYRSGNGLRGGLTWTPVQQIIDALEDAFHASFAFAPKTGKNFYLGVDVSGSMAWGGPAGTNMTCAELAAAMAMVTAKLESNVYIKGFCHQLVDLGITAKDTLHSATKKAQASTFGGTDCAKPMLDALKQKLDVDAFIILTDNETWAGSSQPSQALEKYANAYKPEAKLIVEGFTATNFTIADPKNQNMLDIVGFDSSVPSLISAFVGGQAEAAEDKDE